MAAKTPISDTFYFNQAQLRGSPSLRITYNKKKVSKIQLPIYPQVQDLMFSGKKTIEIFTGLIKNQTLRYAHDIQNIQPLESEDQHGKRP